MPDKYETLVRWFLRFNGYFGIESFIIHEPMDGGNRQGGETDLLGLRLPFSQEKPDFQIVNYSDLVDQEANDRHLIDVVIAEVKNRDDDYLNPIWITDGPKYLDRVAYIIRWIGAFKNEETIKKVANKLKKEYRFREGQFLFRFIYFGRQSHPRFKELGIKQITFQEIIQFILQSRTPSFYVNDLGVRSPHSQWDALIKEIWKIGDPESKFSLAEQEKCILDLLNGSKE